MKKGVLCFVAWSVPFLLLAQTDTPQGIDWERGLSWEQVKQKAKQENKLIFIDAYATWCGPCKEMDKKVYPDMVVGEVVNPKFVSIKLQMDKTPNDNEETKKWYPIIKEFGDKYPIDGYPSFLFFDANGKLVHKALGYLNVSRFIELAKDALTDPEDRYEKSIVKFKKGELDYQFMPDLATQAQSKRNNQIAIEIARAYKEKYLDSLTDENAFQKQNLKFITRFCNVLINSNDRYFKLFYTHPDWADSIMSDKKSRLVALAIIKKDELYDNIYNKDWKPHAYSEPRWKVYERSIRKKYGEKYVDQIYPNEQIDFYQRASNWKNYVRYVNAKIKKYPPQVKDKSIGFLRGGMNSTDANQLNHYAWQLFLYCNDKKYLAKALPWTDLAIKLDSSAHNRNFYDTKANLIYRMGNINEAIELEGFALLRSNNSDKAIIENLRKMKAGLPTWYVLDKKKVRN